MLVFREGTFAQDGLRNRLQRAAAQALQHPAQDQHSQVGASPHMAELMVNSNTQSCRSVSARTELRTSR